MAVMTDAPAADAIMGRTWIGDLCDVMVLQIQHHATHLLFLICDARPIKFHRVAANQTM